MNTLEMKEGGLYDTARLPYEKSEIIHAFHELFLEVNALVGDQ